MGIPLAVEEAVPVLGLSLNGIQPQQAGTRTCGSVCRQKKQLLGRFASNILVNGFGSDTTTAVPTAPPDAPVPANLLFKLLLLLCPPPAFFAPLEPEPELFDG
jgi:hypothetical protein